MTHKRIYLAAIALLLSMLMPDKVAADVISESNYSAMQITGLQSQTTNTILTDNNGFIWISNRNGIDCYDGLNAIHYKLSDLGMRGYRDGMMILMHKDHKGRIWAFTERGNIYQFDSGEDRFKVVLDLYSMELWYSVQTLFVTDDDHLIIGLNEGIVCYDLPNEKLLGHVAKNRNIRDFLEWSTDTLLVASDKGLSFLDLRTNVAHGEFVDNLPALCLREVEETIWIGTRGKGLYHMDRAIKEQPVLVEGSTDIIYNAIDYLDNYGLLLATDGLGLMQLDVDDESGLPTSELLRIAYDNKEASFPTRSGGINDVMVNNGNIWFSMYMGGCMRLIPHHRLITLTNPAAEAPSDNFVYDLDNGPDGSLWVAYNQALVRYDANGEESEIFMNHQSRFLTMKVMPDSTVWAGGYGTGLHHFDPYTGVREWMSSVADAPVNDCIYDLHDTKDGDLWVAGMNFPLTRMHFYENGMTKKTIYPDLIQIFDVETLDDNTLALASSDGIWLLNTKTGESTHHFQVGEGHAWKGTNFVRSIITRGGNEVWIATAGAGLVCYDVKADHYDYFDNLNILPSLELRSVLMLNDSIICASTESNGVFSFNCNTRRTDRSLLLEDDMLRQEFLQNSGIRLANGNLLFGGDHGAILLTPQDICDNVDEYQIFVNGPKNNNKEYQIGHRHRNLFLSFCTNDIYHQDDYKFEYRMEGWNDEWTPTDGKQSLRLVNLPSGDWTLELRAVNSTGLELTESLQLHVNRPIWQRWYAWMAYVVLFFYLVLKIVLYLLRPRIEEM